MTTLLLLVPFLFIDAEAKTFIVKAVDESVTSNTQQDDDDFFFTCDANTTYFFKQMLFVNEGASDSDLDTRWTIPTGASGVVTVDSHFESQTPRGTDDITVEDVHFTSTATQYLLLHGKIDVGGTAGTCQFQWAQTTTFATPTTIQKGSSLEVYQQGITQTAVTSLTHTKVTKSQDDTVNNSIVLVNDSELFFTGTANKVYHFTLMLFVESATNADMREDWTLPSGATGRRIAEDFSWFYGSSASVSDDITVEVTGIQTNGNPQQQQLYGKINMGSTSGIINFQFAQNVAQVSDTKILKGSTLLVYEEGTALASAQGEKGDKGDKGDRGDDGATGARGADGASATSPVTNPVPDPITITQVDFDLAVASAVAELQLQPPSPLAPVESVVQTFFEFAVVDTTHNDLVLNSFVSDQRLGIRWSSGQNIAITSAIPSSSPFTITFEQFPVIKQGSGAVISTNFVSYNLQIPSQKCSNSVRTNCVEPVRYEIPVIVNGIVAGNQVTDTGTITVNLSEDAFDPILLLILAMFGIPLLAVAIQKARGRSATPPVRRIITG